MENIRETAYEILSTVQRIYEREVSENPTAILGKKTFLIRNENGKEVIIPRPNYESRNSSYYFETPEFDGVMIKKEDGFYCIKASVKYTNAKNQTFWFAKIRIEDFHDRDLEVKGMWGGSWQTHDYHDEDLSTNPEFPFALDSMKTKIEEMDNQLAEKKVKSDSFDPDWVQKVKKYNT